MTTFEARIEVMHREGILDPAGATVERALPALGWENVSEVAIGKTIRLRVEAASTEEARTQVDAMCRKLLANPVIEDYTISVTELADVTR